MKNPLNYQLTEYDCGPTSVLNAISFLFEREEIPPEIVRNTVLYCLDRYDSEGDQGKSGTSCMAMMYLSNWLNDFGQTKKLAVSSRYISGESVNLDQNGQLLNAVRSGGAAVVRLYYDVAHYVLMVGEQDGKILLFDPYYRTEAFPQKDIIITADRSTYYNRIVPLYYFDRESQEIYALGKKAEREAVLIFREKDE